MNETAIRTRRWTRREYERLIGMGVLHEDEPIEVIEGRLVVAEPQSDAHARAIELAAEALRAAFGRGWRIRVQLPLAATGDSGPEPDVAVVRGTPRDTGHPRSAALVLEAADWSLRLDRKAKARVYARAGIAEYWIVNLVDRVVEVHCGLTATGRRSGKYREVRVARSGERITPLAAPSASVAVDDLLP